MTLIFKEINSSFVCQNEAIFYSIFFYNTFKSLELCGKYPPLIHTFSKMWLLTEPNVKFIRPLLWRYISQYLFSNFCSYIFLDFYIT